MRSTDKVIKLHAIKENTHSVLLSITNSLKKRYESRTLTEIDSIVFALKYIELLKNLYDKYGQCAQDLSLKYIKYMRYENMTTLLNPGETLNALYIILNGSVEVIGPENHWFLPEGPHAPRSYSFGEWPRPDPNFNSVKVVFHEKTEIAMISHRHLKEIIEKGKIHNKIAFIGSLSFSKGFTEYRISLLLDKFKLQKYRRNDMIFGEKDTNEDIFIVKKGEVKLYKQLQVKEKALGKKENVSPLQIKKQKPIKNVEFLILGKGQIFGDESFHVGGERQISAICSSAKASVYKISFEEFKQNFLVNVDNRKTFQKACDSKMKWREDRLQEMKQSSTTNIKLFENRPRTISAMKKRDSITPILDIQPQMKALQQQMRLSVEGHTSLILDLDSSSIANKSMVGYGVDSKNSKGTNLMKRSVKSRDANSLVFQENSVSASINCIDGSRRTESQKELRSPYMDEEKTIYGFRNGRRIQRMIERANSDQKKPQSSKPASLIFKNKIMQKLNRSSVSTLGIQNEDRNLSRSSLSHINKENSVSSIHYLKNDSSTMSILQMDLFRQTQTRCINTTSKKVKPQVYRDSRCNLSEKKEPGFQRYSNYRSNQNSFADLIEAAARGSELDCVNFVQQNLVEKVLPEKVEPEPQSKLNSELLNYNFGSKLYINSQNIHTIFKSGSDSRGKKRRASKAMTRNIKHLSQDELSILKDLEENAKLQALNQSFV